MEGSEKGEEASPLGSGEKENPKPRGGSAAGGAADGSEKLEPAAGGFAVSSPKMLGTGALGANPGGAGASAEPKLEDREILPTSPTGAFGATGFSPVVVRFRSASQASEEEAVAGGGGAAKV